MDRRTEIWTDVWDGQTDRTQDIGFLLYMYSVNLRIQTKRFR